jgi:hypothetical protein
MMNLDKINDLIYLTQDMSIIKKYFFQRRLYRMRNCIYHQIFTYFGLSENTFKEHERYLDVKEDKPYDDPNYITCSFKENLLDIIREDLNEIEQEIRQYVTVTN